MAPPRPRPRTAVVAVAAIAAAGAMLLAPGRSGTEAAAADDISTGNELDASGEHDGADCDVPDPGDTGAQALLPDPFTSIDGTPVTTVEQWECRRAEIKEQAERTIYGDKPGPPESVSGTVTSSGISVDVTDQGRSTGFNASVSLPEGSGPFPAVIVYGGFGADNRTILDSGAAVIDFDPYTVGAEGTTRENKQGAFYDLHGSSSSTGLLMAWAWGTSRIIDVIEQSDGTVLQNSTGVTGCSRFGKGAFVAGAFDQRIDLTMPIESGTAGVPILRGIADDSGAQPLDSAYGEEPWFGDAFGQYTSTPENLPVDTHEIVGMIAPRGLFIMENPHVEWLGATSGSLGALGGAEVYDALGAGPNLSYWSDVHDGTHCASRPEWQDPLQQSIEAFLLDAGQAPGVFEAAEQASLDDWRDWTTPALS